MVRNIVSLLILFLMLSWMSPVWGKNKVAYIPERKLPRRVVVLFPFAKEGVKIDPAFKRMFRDVVQNYLAGKGYIVRYADKVPGELKDVSLKNFDPKKIVSRLKDVDGLFSITVHEFSGLNIVLLKRFKIDAELCLFDRKGKKLSCWREQVGRRNIDIATDPIGLAAKVLGSVLSDSPKVKLKTLVFDWAYQISGLVPGFSLATKKPKILRVISNVTNKTIKIGDKIVVALEGDPGIEATFDLGTFRQGLKMLETTRAGVYEGFYVVQKGDEARNQYLLVRLKNQQGEKIEWVEFEPPINIDGVPPSPPKALKATLEEGLGVKLTWECLDGSTVAFIVQRSEEPLSGYKEISRVGDVGCVDNKVEEGKKYFYRVAALDQAGNISEFRQIGPVEIPITGGVLSGDLPARIKKGSYKVEGLVRVPAGARTVFDSGVKISFGANGTLEIAGELAAEDLILTSENGTWKGVIVKPEGAFTGKRIKILKAERALLVEGRGNFTELFLYEGSVGLEVNGELFEVSVSRGKARGFERAVILQKGVLKLSKFVLEENGVALKVEKGDMRISQVNFLTNKVDIEAEVPVVIKKCFLGHDPLDFKLTGPVTVVSYLDLPYPDGKVVPFDQEAFKKKGEELLAKGKEFIRNGNYGKACENLENAFKILQSEEIYYWLVYVYTMLEEDEKLAQIIDKALQEFPYEAKIYQLAARYYLFKDKIEEAEKLINRALKLQPNNSTLESLKTLIESQKQKGENKK